MSVTPVAVPGTVVCSLVLRPHATTVPASNSAMLWDAPAATAATPDKLGVVVCPLLLEPQATTGFTGAATILESNSCELLPVSVSVTVLRVGLDALVVR